MLQSLGDKFKLKFAIICCGLFLCLFIHRKSAIAQDYVQPVADYSFENNQVVDNTGNTSLHLYNSTSLYNDTERGKVLRLYSTKKSYAVLNKQLLNSNSCTISFFFYWDNTGVTSWHQVFEIHNAQTGSNFYFTPQNGWGTNQCSLISDCKEYGAYENVDAQPLSKNTWMHIAVTIDRKLASLYINGKLASRGNIMFTPDLIHGDSLYFGGNPYRSDNYYISARLDDIKIFNVPLYPNQIQALYSGSEIPEPKDSGTIWETSDPPLQLTVDLNAKRQTIRNFGSSDAWNTEQIGKFWPFEKKSELAKLLFSIQKDQNGSPVGIGLSAWRFNIGAGTAEQGNASRISNISRRTEGFINPDSVTYNWNKQSGQQWFLKEAAVTYNVPDIIGWVNSPPVLYTTNNLGFREYGTPVATILKKENFDDYAGFLANVVEHFDTGGVHFDFISPLNEPQWEWAPSTSGGTVDQEGSPWTNQEIYDIALAINNEFSERGIGTQIFLSEAGSIANLLRGTGHADNQLSAFWNQNSTLSLAGMQKVSNIVSFHSYWSDYGDLLVDDRNSLFENAQELNPAPELWQTEYSLLGSGYREGFPASQKLSEMDCALSLSRIIMADLNISNTSAWQWWTTFEKGKHAGESRFCLIEAFTNAGKNDGEYYLNKLFFSFGNFSHFIRPGMKRIETLRSDQLNVKETYQDVVFSAYINDTENKLVLVAVNFTAAARAVTVSLVNTNGKTIKNPSLFLTDEYTDLKKQDIDLSPDGFIVPAHSVITFTADLEAGTTDLDQPELTEFNVLFNTGRNELMATWSTGLVFQQVILYGISGNVIQIKQVEPGQDKVTFNATNLSSGVYLVSGKGNRSVQTRKISIAKR